MNNTFSTQTSVTNTIAPVATGRRQHGLLANAKAFLRAGLCLALGGILLAPSSGAAEQAKHRADRLLAKPRPEAVSANGQGLAQVHRALGAEVLREYSEVGGLQVIQIPPGLSLQQAIGHYEASGLFEYLEPDYEITVDATPTDPYFNSGYLWGLHNTGSGGTADADIDAPEAWDMRTDASSVVVAVIDTGIRYTHEDLAANMWRNPGEIAGNGVDDDHNGYIDDVYGVNAILNNGNPSDDNGHGTHCAGTIGAVGNNGKGVAGVAWKVKLMACKFLDANGSGYTSDAIECINYARAKGAHIMNNSWGGGSYSTALRDAIASARNAGMIFVAAAGNSATDNDITPQYPSSYDVDNVVAVMATDRYDQMAAAFSCYGQRSVDLAAPGVGIYSSVNTSDSAYGSKSGTSMATPHVTGALALLKAQNPSLTYSQLIQRLLDTTDRLPSLTGRCVSGGRLNVQNALRGSGASPCTYTLSPGNATMGAAGGNGSVSVSANSGCAWTASSSVSWLSITAGRSGTGAGTVYYSVAPNTTGSQRTGTLVIAGRTFTVMQNADCAFTVSTAFKRSGGAGLLYVTTASACTWTAQPNVEWITIKTAANGSGSGTIAYKVSKNTGIEPRIGTITIAGQTHTVTQAGKP